MSVLLVTPDFPPAHGGIQELMESLVRASRRHVFTVLTTGHADAAAFDASLDADVLRLPSAGSRHVELAGLNATIPVVAARRRPDAILCGHVVCMPGALLARRLLGVPLITYVYAMEVAARVGLAAFVLPRADRVIAVSKYSRQLALDSGARAPAIRVVHPGVSDAPVETPSSREPIVLTIARLQNRYKGFDVMLRAMPLILAQIPDAQWLIGGDGPLRQELEDTAERMGLADRVAFLGRVSDQRRDELLSQARVFSMPSRVVPGGAGEGFGIVYLEAARFGVPSVAARQGGSVDAVISGETGTLVDPEDHDEVAAAVVDLLRDGAKWRRYSAQARRFAQGLTWGRMAEGVGAVLDEVLDDCRQSRERTLR